MARTLTEDQSGNLTFQERATDVDQDQITVDKVELDAIDGTTQSGGARDPSWLSHTTTFNAGDPSEMLIDATIDASELSQGTTYTFLFEVSDGIETTTRTVDLEVVDPSGSIFVISGWQSGNIWEYEMSTSWDVATASQTDQFSHSTETPLGQGIFIKPDGLKLYLTGMEGGGGNGRVYEYNLSTAWDITTASLVHSTFISSSVQGVFFKNDGAKMYVVNGDNESVEEYALATPWDVSSQSLINTFVVSSQDTRPSGVTFKPDGSKMYVTGRDNDSLYEYDLSSPWDTTNASVNQSTVVEETPNAVSFKTDGTVMFVIGDTNNKIAQYTLSTPWDISTKTLDDTFGVGGQESNPQALFFRGEL